MKPETRFLRFQSCPSGIFRSAKRYCRTSKVLPAVASHSPPREATIGRLNARHEGNLPRQLLDICGLHSARNLRDLNTNSSNANPERSEFPSSNHVRRFTRAIPTRFTCKQQRLQGNDPVNREDVFVALKKDRTTVTCNIFFFLQIWKLISICFFLIF